MRYAQSAVIDSGSTIEEVSIRQLRLWSSPEIIMVATNLTDDLTILPHAILQARQSGAKILLVHVDEAPGHLSRLHKWCQQPTTRRNAVRPTLDRMAQQLRWVGITCEPTVLHGVPEEELPLFAKTHGIDRLIMGFGDDPDLTASRSRSFAERILPVMEVPVCVIGRHVSLSSPNGFKARNITLAVSLNADCHVQLGFASRLAQETHANLSLLHVTECQDSNVDRFAHVPVEVTSRLPLKAWREAELFCPTEISIREGDPALEILRHISSQKEGSIILCSTGIASARQRWRDSVSYRVLTEARYPVFIVETPARAAATEAISRRLPVFSESQQTLYQKIR
jgi:nucleotide-binding universal stress UspA family protein